MPSPRSERRGLDVAMLLNLDHIAIAVPDLSEAIRRFAEDLGLELTGSEDVQSAQTTTAFFPVSRPETPTKIELVTPLDGKGPIARSLEKRGPGLHHLAFRTDDIEGDVAKLKDKGYRFTTDEIGTGAHGTRIIFVHPSSTGGVLLELVEYPDHG